MYERNESKYRYPLSQMDEMPDFNVNIFVYNPKTISDEENVPAYSQSRKLDSNIYLKEIKIIHTLGNMIQQKN